MRTAREVMQLELDAFHFYKLARDQARHWEQRAVLDRMYDAALKILHTLDQQYHVHLDTARIELSLEEQNRLAQSLFRGICLSEHSGILQLYSVALAMERHMQAQLRKLQAQLPPGSAQQACSESASETNQRATILETELEAMSALAAV